MSMTLSDLQNVGAIGLFGSFTGETGLVTPHSMGMPAQQNSGPMVGTTGGGSALSGGNHMIVVWFFVLVAFLAFTRIAYEMSTKKVGAD